MPEDELPRIGRPANPAERGFQLVVENEYVLERVTRNYFGAQAGLFGLPLLDAWNGMAADEREEWRARALVELRLHTDGYSPQGDPPEPRPGGRAPVPASAHVGIAKRIAQ